MPLTAVSTTILFGILMTLTLLAFFTLKSNGKQHRWLVIFLFILTGLQLESFLIQTEWILQVPHFLNTSTPLLLTLGPVILFYIKDRAHGKCGKYQGIHFLPALAYGLYSFHFYLQTSAFKTQVIQEEFYSLTSETANRIVPSWDTDPWDIQGWVVVEGITLHLTIYLCWSAYWIFSHRAARNWIWETYLVVILALGTGLLFSAQGGVIEGTVFFENPISSLAPDLFSSAAVYLVLLFVLVHPRGIHEKEKYAKSGMSSQLITSKKEYILTTIKDRQLFKRQDFSLEMVVQHTSLNRHQISQIINQELGISFYELAHQLRIEEAIKLIRTQNDLSMEQIGLAVGYKSKSTFYKAFKNRMGTTPNAYKNAIYGDADPANESFI